MGIVFFISPPVTFWFERLSFYSWEVLEKICLLEKTWTFAGGCRIRGTIVNTGLLARYTINTETK
ncbi:MAG: hypothetical protein A2Y65_06535 [Deltaproteobacteria bacterium RBG_13_52_11]|nr:MAG: hypothetical protein A2Y65_06535 [Deltaproteobacteria bacterium RBG_13_52_11]